MKFQKLELQNIPFFKEYYDKYTNKTCDRTIGGAFMWREFYDTQYALCDDTLLVKCGYKGNTMFCFPVGEHKEKALEALEGYCQENNLPMLFVSLVEEEAMYLKEKYPQACVTKEDEWSDYVYLCEEHANFPGKKFHTQKNHANKFKKTYEDWSLEKITTENLPAVKAFFAMYEKEDTKDSETAVEEKIRTREVLDCFDAYGLEGYALYANGQVAGFAICELVGQVLFIHIEKVNKEVVGANATIVQQVAKQYEGQALYINREDDAGDEGLRYSKVQYRPVMMLDKYEVEVPIHGKETKIHQGPVRKCACSAAGCQ